MNYIITALKDKRGGVRRFQNEDGSLTSAGGEKSVSSLSKREQKKLYAEVNNAVAKRSQAEFAKLNKKWEGKYNTPAYEKSANSLMDKMFQEENKRRGYR